MNISAPFIQRPIATALLMVGLLAGGLVAYPLLPVAALPNVNYPTLQVTAQLPGADPQTMASSVATPLELQFGQIPGLTQMTSASALGFTQVTLQFDDKDRFSSYRTTSPELATESGSRVGDSFTSLRDSYGPTLRALDVGARSTPRAGFWYVGVNLKSALLFSIAGANLRSISGGSIEICE